MCLEFYEGVNEKDLREFRKKGVIFGWGWMTGGFWRRSIGVEF